MKGGLEYIVGKTISNVVYARRGEFPNQQVFLTFTDGTYFEFWGDTWNFNCARGLDRGGLEDVKTYIGREGKIQAIYSQKL